MIRRYPSFFEIHRRYAGSSRDVKVTSEEPSTQNAPSTEESQAAMLQSYQSNPGLVAGAVILSLFAVGLVLYLLSYLIKRRRKNNDAKKASFVILPETGPVRDTAFLIENEEEPTSDIQFTLPTTCISPESRSPSLASRKSICSECEFKESSPILGGRYRSNSSSEDGDEIKLLPSVVDKTKRLPRLHKKYGAIRSDPRKRRSSSFSGNFARCVSYKSHKASSDDLKSSDDDKKSTKHSEGHIDGSTLQPRRNDRVARRRSSSLPGASTHESTRGSSNDGDETTLFQSVVDKMKTLPRLPNLYGAIMGDTRKRRSSSFSENVNCISYENQKDDLPSHDDDVKPTKHFEGPSNASTLQPRKYERIVIRRHSSSSLPDLPAPDIPTPGKDLLDDGEQTTLLQSVVDKVKTLPRLQQIYGAFIGDPKKRRSSSFSGNFPNSVEHRSHKDDWLPYYAGAKGTRHCEGLSGTSTLHPRRNEKTERIIIRRSSSSSLPELPSPGIESTTKGSSDDGYETNILQSMVVQAERLLRLRKKYGTNRRRSSSFSGYSTSVDYESLIEDFQTSDYDVEPTQGPRDVSLLEASSNERMAKRRRSSLPLFRPQGIANPGKGTSDGGDASKYVRSAFDLRKTLCRRLKKKCGPIKEHPRRRRSSSFSGKIPKCIVEYEGHEDNLQFPDHGVEKATHFEGSNGVSLLEANKNDSSDENDAPKLLRSAVGLRKTSSRLKKKHVQVKEDPRRRRSSSFSGIIPKCMEDESHRDSSDENDAPKLLRSAVGLRKTSARLKKKHVPIKEDPRRRRSSSFSGIIPKCMEDESHRAEWPSSDEDEKPIKHTKGRSGASTLQPRRNVPVTDRAARRRSSSLPRMSDQEIPGPQKGMQCGLGSINPEIYKSVESLLLWNNPEPPYPDDHLGRVWYALEYDKTEEKLMVTVVKAKNLPSRSLGAYYCDPYVRVWLMPDDRRYHQSKQKLKTCNPVFDETFVFHVPVKELQERIIKISVQDGGRNRKMREIGQMIFPLHKFNPEYSMSTWADLRHDYGTSISDLGEIRLGMMYNDDLHRLSVTVMETKRIQISKLERQQHVDHKHKGHFFHSHVPSDSDCSVFVKLTLHHKHKLVKTKKTKHVPGNREQGKYEFHEAFNFKLQGDSLATSNLNVCVLQIGPGKAKERQLGRVNIGSFMFARGRALAHWDDTITNPRKNVQRWHALME